MIHNTCVKCAEDEGLHSWCALCGEPNFTSDHVSSPEQYCYDLGVSERDIFGSISVSPNDELTVCAWCHGNFEFKGIRSNDSSDNSQDWDHDPRLPDRLGNLSRLQELQLEYGELAVGS
jgi:hypothetical protein